MSDYLKNFHSVLQGLIDGQAAVQRAMVMVERAPSTIVPGLSAYRLEGQTREAVLACIDARMHEAEDAPGGGWAQFLHPWLDTDGKWKSRGEVMRYPAEAGA